MARRSSTKMDLNFDEFEVYRKKLAELSGGETVEKAMTGALKETQQIVAQEVGAAMTPHNKSGNTSRSILLNGDVEWSGGFGKVSVGFDINAGGLPSIFLMYGTKRGIEADKNLYNAVFGAATRKKVQDAQKRAFEKALGEVMK